MTGNDKLLLKKQLTQIFQQFRKEHPSLSTQQHDYCLVELHKHKLVEHPSVGFVVDREHLSSTKYLHLLLPSQSHFDMQ